MDLRARDALGRSGCEHGGEGAPQLLVAAFAFNLATVARRVQPARLSASATVEPSSAALGATKRPYDFMISAFSEALSPSAEMIAPAWPMRRPFGAVSPAT